MSIRSVLRWTKRRLLRHRQGPRPNVALVGVRRGGSSLLSDLIASQRGMWYVSEPFAVFDGHESASLASRHLPRLPHSQFFDLSAADDAAVRAYVALLNRAAIPLGTARRSRFPLTSDRVCLKILNAPFLTDEFATRDGMQVIVLVRHPAAQALSVLRQGWGMSAEAYFARPDFLASYLTGEQIEFGARTLTDGGPWERAILNWVIETLYPLRHAAHAALTLTYEELVVLPDLAIGHLAKVGAFEEPAVMRAIADRPSGSSRMSTSETIGRIASADRWGLVDSWAAKVTPEQVRSGQAILDAMGEDAYRMDDPLPAQRLRIHRDELARVAASRR